MGNWRGKILPNGADGRQAVKVCLFLSEYVTMQKNEKEGEKDVSVT